jgi:hypothetical protein
MLNRGKRLSVIYCPDAANLVLFSSTAMPPSSPLLRKRKALDISLSLWEMVGVRERSATSPLFIFLGGPAHSMIVRL